MHPPASASGTRPGTTCPLRSLPHLRERAKPSPERLRLAPWRMPPPAPGQVAYNLVYCLGQHAYDADCNLFLRILSGDVEEGVRGEQATLEQEVLRCLRLVDASVNRQVHAP